MEAVALDTNVFVNVKNEERPFFEHSKKLLDLIDDGKLKAIVPSLVIAEMCVGYLLHEDEEGMRAFVFHIAGSPHYRVVQVDLEVAVLGARIRAETGARLPDALIAASAVVGGAEALVTHDEEMKKVSKFVRVLTAEEALALLG